MPSLDQVSEFLWPTGSHLDYGALAGFLGVAAAIVGAIYAKRAVFDEIHYRDCREVARNVLRAAVLVRRRFESTHLLRLAVFEPSDDAVHRERSKEAFEERAASQRNALGEAIASLRHAVDEASILLGPVARDPLDKLQDQYSRWLTATFIWSLYLGDENSARGESVADARVILTRNLEGNDFDREVEASLAELDAALVAYLRPRR